MGGCKCLLIYFSISVDGYSDSFASGPGKIEFLTPYHLQKLCFGARFMCNNIGT